MSRFLYQSAQGSTAWLLAMWAVCFALPARIPNPSTPPIMILSVVAIKSFAVRRRKREEPPAPESPGHLREVGQAAKILSSLVRVTQVRFLYFPHMRDFRTGIATAARFDSSVTH